MAKPVTKKEILDQIATIELEFPNLPPGLLRSVAKQESLNHKQWRKVIAGEIDSTAGAQGLFQFMPDTAKDEGVDVTDFASSTRGAGRYLTKLKKQTGTLSGALAAYNWGIGNYNKWVKGLKNMPEETQKYIPEIMGRMQRETITTAGDKTQTAVAAPPAIPSPSSIEMGSISPSQPINMGSVPTGGTEQIPQAGSSQPISIPAAPGSSQPISIPAAPGSSQPISIPAAPGSSQGITPSSPMSDPTTGTGGAMEQPVYAMETPAGIQVVIPQSKKEEGILASLKPGETNLLNHIDTLSSMAKGARLDKPLIGATKPDHIDKILLDVVKGVSL